MKSSNHRNSRIRKPYRPLEGTTPSNHVDSQSPSPIGIIERNDFCWSKQTNKDIGKLLPDKAGAPTNVSHVGTGVRSVPHVHPPKSSGYATDNTCNHEIKAPILHKQTKPESRNEKSSGPVDPIRSTPGVDQLPYHQWWNSVFDMAPSTFLSTVPSTSTKDNNNSREQDQDPKPPPHHMCQESQLAKKDYFSVLRDSFLAVVTGWFPSVFAYPITTGKEESRQGNDGDDDMSSVSECSSSNSRVTRRRIRNDRIFGDVPLIISFVPVPTTPSGSQHPFEMSFFGLKINLSSPWSPSADEVSVDLKSPSLANNLGRKLLELPAVKQLAEMLHLKQDTTASTENETDWTNEHLSVSDTSKRSLHLDESSGEAKTSVFQWPTNDNDHSDYHQQLFPTPQRLNDDSSLARRTMYRRQDSWQSTATTRSRPCNRQRSGASLDELLYKRKTLYKQRQGGSSSCMSTTEDKRSLYKRQSSSQSLISRRSLRNREFSRRNCMKPSSSRRSLNHHRRQPGSSQKHHHPRHHPRRRHIDDVSTTRIRKTKRQQDDQDQTTTTTMRPLYAKEMKDLAVIAH